MGTTFVSYSHLKNSNGVDINTYSGKTKTTWTSADTNNWNYWKADKMKAWNARTTAEKKANYDKCVAKCDKAAWDADDKANTPNEADESDCYCGRAKFCAEKVGVCWNTKDASIADEPCRKLVEAPDAECNDAEIKAMRQLKGCYDQVLERQEEKWEETYKCEDYEDDCKDTFVYLAMMEEEDDWIQDDYEWDGCGATSMFASWLAVVSLFVMRF